MRIRPSLPILLALACSSVPTLASPDSVVVFNEIQYNPAGQSEAGEWIELFNQMGIKVDVSGWRIDAAGYQFPPGTIINPGAYVVVAKTPGAGQFGPLTANISNSGQRLRLINHSDRMMDEIDFGDDDPWPAGTDGSGSTLAKVLPYTASTPHANWTVSSQTGGTPGTVNFPAAGAPPPVTTVQVFGLSNVWRYNQSGADLGTNWAATAHPLGGAWFSGPGALGYETSLTVSIGTPLTFPGSNTPYVMTYYFETEFNVTAAQLASLSSLKIRHALDDGAVFYINGSFATSVNMPGGTVTAATAATLNVEAGTAVSGNLPLPTTALVAGANRLSVEVHQFQLGNSDIVFGAELEMDILQSAPSAPPLRLAEIPAATVSSWWMEIANASGAPVDLAGIVISAGGDTAREYTFPSGTLAGGGLLLLDEATLGFRPLESEKVFLYNPGKTALLDGRQQTGRLRGRSESRGGAWAWPSAATPGAANTFVFNDSVVISEIQYNPPALAPVPAVPPTFQTTTLIGFSEEWRYNSADENLPAEWATVEHPVAGNWRSGPGPLGVEVITAPLSVPLATTITPYVPATVTYYFEKEFTVTAQQLATATSLEITHQIDDGAVFYLNGKELPSRFGMPNGVVGPETLATGSIGDAALVSLVFSTADLLVGTNRLSVEVHQNGTGSSDLVFGLKLDARVQLTAGSPGQPLRNSDNQWIELANRSAAPVNLTGWDFGDGLTFAFPPGTSLAPGEHACVVRDAALFSAAYPGARVLGQFDGSLSRGSEHIVLRDALRNTVDEVRYHDDGAWPEYADGGGTSAELTDLDADNMAGSAWAASDESSRTAWKTYTYRGTAAASNGGPDTQWSEFNMGMLGAGEVWIDDVSVIELPDGAATQKLTDTAFNNAVVWRRLGNHRHSAVIDEPGNPANKILRLVATGPTEHMHNQIYTTLASPVVNGREYQISFRARWVAGSNQLHSRLYFNRLARVNVIDRVSHPGTPSAPNSRAVANLGPTYSGLKHSPAVPAVSQAATISATASDPDNVAAMTLFYSVNGGAFQSAAMTLVGGRYQAGIPGQTAGAVVQFYLQGTDGAGATSFHPPGGPSSRALYKVNDNTAATTGLHNFRLITTTADRDWMHTNYNVMSNDRIECTVIDRENDIYYGAGVHLKSSERGRNQLTRVGYNIDFPPDGLFRGAHGSVGVDRSEGQAPGQAELLFDIMISNSGGPISRYYDFVKILAPHNTLIGGAVLQLARYDDVFLDSQFENGSDGRLYEYELVYYPASADANGNKLNYPSPDGVIGIGVSNHGDDPERYRWHFLNKINREADDFTPMINYAKHFSKSGAEFEAGLNSVIDLDAWFRGLSYAVLTGANDNTAGDGAQHNGFFYARPDGRMIFLPHDMDNGLTTTLGIFNNPQCATLTANPARRRLYLGHLHDIISTTYNNSYMSIWTTHLATLDPAQNWASELSYMTSRSNYVLSQINSQIPPVGFSITTASPLTVAASTATIAGDGWVNVRGIRVAGNPEFLAVTWTDNNSWQLSVPAPPGQSTVTLEAVNFSGAVIGTATIVINNTTTITPATAGHLVVSEIMYHPSDLTAAEILAGFTDSDQFEYVEIMNISELTLNLAGVRFTGGIEYDFAASTMIVPGARLIVARDRAAFLSRYPAAAGSLAAGAFLNATRLDNSGEGIVLSDAAGAVIKSFTYDDAPPWPVAADGSGSSLTLVAPATNPDHDVAANWRSSVLPGGTPGASDATPFTGDPAADADRDGLSAFLEHALGTSDTAAGVSDISIIYSADGYLTFEHTRNLAADDAIHEVQLSTDLTNWNSTAFSVISETAHGDGTSRVNWRSVLPAPEDRAFTRLRVRSR